ncbi:hypothetical protein MMPV_002614 [Pyropia vietnamensis]
MVEQQATVRSGLNLLFARFPTSHLHTEHGTHRQPVAASSGEHETVSEFGKGLPTRYYHEPPSSEDEVDDAPNRDSGGARGGVNPSHPVPLRRVRRRLLRPRHLRQYIQDGTLVREHATRAAGPSELFFDLIIVSTLAALGHQLRVKFGDSGDLQKIFLLFTVVWFSWRDTVYLVNVLGSESDLWESVCTLVVMLPLTGIGVGSHDLFTTTSSWVCASCFLTFAFIAVALLLASRAVPPPVEEAEPTADPNFDPSAASDTSSSEDPAAPATATFPYLVVSAALVAVASLPYLAAAFLSSKTAIVALLWVGFALNLPRESLMQFLAAQRVRKRRHLVIPATNIEALSERYALLTLIVTGESLLSILFEASSVLTADDDRVSVVRLFLSSALGLVVAYSFYTWYFSTDNAPPLPHGRHAIRFHRVTAILWTHLHLFYHAAILFTATGVGLAVRTAALIAPPAPVPSSMALAAAAVVRAGSGSTPTQAFGSAARGATALSWGATLILSALMGAVHQGGPRASTRRLRLPLRVAVAVGVGLALGLLPEDRLGPLAFLGVMAGVGLGGSVLEQVAVAADHVGYFRRENGEEGQYLGESPETMERDREQKRRESQRGEEAA